MVTLTMGSGNLTAIKNPDGGLRTLTYDGSHKLSTWNFAGLSSTYAYDASGVWNSVTPGGKLPVNV